MHWYLEVLKKYAVFTGRAGRKECWIFFLFNIIIAFVLGFIERMLKELMAGDTNSISIMETLYQLAVLIPSIAVGVRRMHDTDRSGWWLLLPIVNLVFLAQDSQPGDNRFGPNPRAATPQSPYKREGKAMYCTKCGEPIQEGAKFCGKCGNPIKQA